MVLNSSPWPTVEVVPLFPEKVLFTVPAAVTLWVWEPEEAIESAEIVILTFSHVPPILPLLE